MATGSDSGSGAGTGAVSAEGAGITESGVGSRAGFRVRGAGGALIKDSVDELLGLGFDLLLLAEPVDDIDGRLGEFASMS